jgi:hypothetical protein
VDALHQTVIATSTPNGDDARRFFQEAPMGMLTSIKRMAAGDLIGEGGRVVPAASLSRVGSLQQ